jgi:sugar/nucleoside kinase (ribokinase family)
LRGEITLVSTRTVDHFPPDAQGHRRSIPGGPAHYIGAALDRLKVPYRLITGPVCSVEVLPVPGGEEYLIQPIPRIPLPDRLTSPATILSPISREIAPESLPEVDGILALDLQGFVRHPGRPTTELETVNVHSLLARADVVKGSPVELGHLDPGSLEALQDTILLTTKGEKGVGIAIRGQKHFVPSRPVHTPHTIGAGDTYLGAFVAFLLDGLDPLSAAERAARFTEEVLRERAAPD